MAKVLSLEATRKELRKLADSTQTAIHHILDTESVYQEQLLDTSLTWFEIGKRRKQGYFSAREIMDEVEIALREELVLIPQYKLYAWANIEDFNINAGGVGPYNLNITAAELGGTSISLDVFGFFAVDDIVRIGGAQEAVNNNYYTVSAVGSSSITLIQVLSGSTTIDELTGSATLSINLIERDWTPQSPSGDPRVVYSGPALVTKLELFIDTIQDMDSELGKIDQQVMDAFIAGEGWDYINSILETGYDKLEDLRRTATAMLEQLAVREQFFVEATREIDSFDFDQATATITVNTNIYAGDVDSVCTLIEGSDILKIAGSVESANNQGAIVDTTTSDTITFVAAVFVDSTADLAVSLTLLEEG